MTLTGFLKKVAILTLGFIEKARSIYLNTGTI